MDPILQNIVLSAVHRQTPAERTELKNFANAYSRCFKCLDTLEKQLNTQRNPTNVYIRRVLHRELSAFQEHLDGVIRRELPEYWIPLKTECQLRRQQQRTRRQRDRECKRANRNRILRKK